MSVTVCQIFKKMDVQCYLFKLLLFQMLVAWCAAKHITINLAKDNIDIEGDVQDSIRNMMYTGIYSHKHLDASKAQVVRPVKVTAEGALVSRVVDHAHEHGHARARRDLHHTEHDQPHVVHYNLTVDGRELRLDLRPSVTFITPAMIVERHSVRGRTRDRPHPNATACHYTGTVQGQPYSSVALSACDGLAGMLRTEQGEYWIEPSHKTPNDHSEGRPHVIFRRSAVDKLKALERAKREINSNTNTNAQTRNNNSMRNAQANKRNRLNAKRLLEKKEAKDKRRREYLEQRRKRLEMLRNNPTEYRRQQAILRMEQRRKQSNSNSNSVNNSRSSQSSETMKKTRSKLNEQQRLRRLRNRMRRKRSKNCGTKQHFYLWKKENDQRKELARKNRSNRRSGQFQNLLQHSGASGSRRSTRSVSKPRHVEVLLVADKSMTEFHERGSLETYLLTIMNMVSSLYMDHSIGNYIKVVVVKIILVEESEAARHLSVSTDADMTLESFCRWQQKLNPEDDENPHHHDVAILVTRQDICSQHDAPCSTLGVAHVAGMCKPDRSCSVNEDNGIMLAHTITHELGHNFGLYHDTEKIGCHPRDGLTLHIMTPIFEPDTVQVAWSRCSKRDVTNFLDAGLGECLSDQPSQEYQYEYPEVPAGVTFNADSQCRLQFGADAVVCAKPSELCEHLWCLVNNTCKTMLRPAAPGTTCGENMWCQNLTCVPRMPSPEPQDGGWGPWTEWSPCSRTCGAGVSTQTRECNNPEPQNNGKYCIGDRSRYKICNTDPCPINEPSYRSVQCSKYNNMTYMNETITDWVAYLDPDNPCELQCRSSAMEMAGGFVADGTPCRQNVGTRDMCISGVCYKVGCDWVVGSDVEEDKCGVCGGTGSDCKTVQGIYTKGTSKQSGFSEVAIIPAGSRNVKIEEKVRPGNYLTLRSAKTQKIYLNGARNATVTEYFVAGTQAIYERDRDWEKVRITGPLREDIKVFQRIYSGRHLNPGVTFQYTVDKQQVAKKYRYRVSEWSPCSVTCGLGYMRRTHECVDEHNRAVERSSCYHIEPPRHEALMQQCLKPACAPHPPPTPPTTHRPPMRHSTPTPHILSSKLRAPRTHTTPAPTTTRRPTSTHTPPAAHTPRTHWWAGTWRPCSKPCTMPGQTATKQRNVYCVDKVTNKVIKDSECDEQIKPISSIKCADVPAC